jgi:hypothetical protein
MLMFDIRNALITILTISSLSTPVIAETLKLDANDLYLGLGVSWNDYDGLHDNAFGYQFFAGLPIPVDMGKIGLAAEVGYMNAGEADIDTPFGNNGKAEADGIWANAVFDIPMNESVELLGRIGLDFGDDDGLMIGAGIGIPMNNDIDLRFEYVIRDNIKSLQANLKFDIF